MGHKSLQPILRDAAKTPLLRMKVLLEANAAPKIRFRLAALT